MVSRGWARRGIIFEEYLGVRCETKPLITLNIKGKNRLALDFIRAIRLD
jgi:hypothetical protein